VLVPSDGGTAGKYAVGQDIGACTLNMQAVFSGPCIVRRRWVRCSWFRALAHSNQSIAGHAGHDVISKSDGAKCE
jgi:hypothetical protein